MGRGRALCFALTAACGRVSFESVPTADVASASADALPCSASLAGPAGWWQFDEGQGVLAADTAGASSGTLLAGPAWTTGRFGGALAFDGIDDHVDLAGSVVYATQSAPFSFSAWFDLSDFTADVPDIMQIRTDTAAPWHVLMSTDPKWRGISTGSGGGAWVPIMTGVLPTTGVWHHVLVRYSGVDSMSVDSFEIFLDGVAQPVMAASGYGTQTQQSRIGAAQDPRNQWTGRIDDIRIYSRSLSNSEVAELASGCH